MTAPTDSYSSPSGQVLYGGLATPSTTPAWLSGKPLNEWVAIANTVGADGATIDPWCGFTLKQSNAELFFALSGGHLDSADTRVSSIVLSADTPAWLAPRRKDSIPSGLINPNNPYSLDGTTPTSRHTRYSLQYSPFSDRLILMGSPSLYGDAVVSLGNSNGFDLTTNTWDAPGTWPSTANGSNWGQCIDDLGNIWCRGQKWLRASNTFLTLTQSGSSAFFLGQYNPVAFDTTRRQLFHMYYGDGQSFNGTFGWTLAVRSENSTSSVTQITFNSGAAWTELQSLNPSYCAMTYNPHLDVFYFYYGYGASQGVVYVVTPNSTTTWDVSKITLGAVTPPTPPASGAGINARLQYSTLLKGLVLLPQKSSSIYFMRTS